MPLKIRQTNKTDNWITPPELVRSLGSFDLDPCASITAQTKHATMNFHLPEHNGLLEPWVGRVWCNPPFSEMSAWANRFALHPDGIMICPLRMRVKWAQVLFDSADGILFMREQVRWVSPDGITKLGDLFDFMLVANGYLNVNALQDSKIRGVLFQRKSLTRIAS